MKALYSLVPRLQGTAEARNNEAELKVLKGNSERPQCRAVRINPKLKW